VIDPSRRKIQNMASDGLEKAPVRCLDALPMHYGRWPCGARRRHRKAEIVQRPCGTARSSDFTATHTLWVGWSYARPRLRFVTLVIEIIFTAQDRKQIQLRLSRRGRLTIDEESPRSVGNPTDIRPRLAIHNDLARLRSRLRRSFTTHAPPLPPM
jgi:hypothetical protein